MSLSRRHLATAAIAVAVAAASWLAFDRSATHEPAPQVNYTLLDGQQTSTDKLKGQVVLVNFWATSCTTCVAEMPEIMATHEKFKGKGYQTVAVAMAYDPPAYVSNFAQTRRLPFGVAIDNTGAIARSFGDIRLTPTTFLINKRGEIVKRYVGAPDFEALHTLVEKLLAEKA
jgi:peroxiredoxin